MDADRPLKELFRLRPRDLLGLTGDKGAGIVSTGVVELAALSRRADTVLRLRRGRQEYLRHVEFEMKYRKGLELRCFEYATRLAVRFRMPVLTTVVLVRRSGPRELVYREVLGRRVVHERRFDVVRLWELDPERALRLGPGAAALIGPSERTTLAQVERAARLIERRTKALAQADLLFILQAFSRQRYTAEELGGVIPKETVMASSLWAEAVSKGRKEGTVQDARAVCLALVREYRPQIADRVVPIIESCTAVDRLHEWAVQAPRLSDAEFEELLGRESTPARPTTGDRRTPRPSRRAKAKRSR